MDGHMQLSIHASATLLCVLALCCALGVNTRAQETPPRNLRELGEQSFPGVEIPHALDEVAVKRATAGGLPYESRGVFGMGPQARAGQVRAAIKLANIPAVAGPAVETWQSVHDHYHVPLWLQDAKFGIFIHFGLYSIPGVNEWYQKYMYSHGEIRAGHVARFGPLNEFGYKDFIPLFTLSKFDPDEWAELFAASGARWVMPTAEHHDGYSLWNSKVNPFNSVHTGPNRDFIGDLSAAVRKHGMKFGVTNHTIEHYDFIETHNIPADVKTDLDDPAYVDFYWTNHSDDRLTQHLANWLKRNVELIDQYQPDLMWFDNGINHRMFDPLKLKVAAYYFNRADEWHKDVTLTGKGTSFIAGSVQDFENIDRAPKQATKFTWMVHDRLIETWGWSENAKITDTGEVIRRLVDVVSRNGVYALNVAPQGDGSIPDNQQQALRKIGAWLAVNGEGIYGTRLWKAGSADPNLRFTRKKEAIYAFFFDWPASSESISIKSLARSDTAPAVANIELLGCEMPLRFSRSVEALDIILPAKAKNNYAFCLKICLEQEDH